LELVFFFEGGGGQALHGSGDLLGYLGENLGVVEVGGGYDDGLGAANGFGALLGIVFYVEGVARSFMKIPEPTKMASAPSCIIRAASAGVAMPPAENSARAACRFARPCGSVRRGPGGPWRRR